MSGQADIWRHMAECAIGIADAIDEQDNIVGTLWSRGFLYDISALNAGVREDIADICLHPENADV